jgi:hypothetical protein
MGADNSFYVKSIATYAPTFFGYIISVLAIVATAIAQCVCGFSIGIIDGFVFTDYN